MSTPKAKGNAGAAATHSGGMRAEAKKTRVVFKNVLDTPFNIPWPEVTSENNAIVLDVLCDLMKPIREYRRSGRKAKNNAKHDSKPALDHSNPSTVPQPSVKGHAAKSSKPKRALAMINHDPQQPQPVTTAEESQHTQKKNTPLEPPAIFESTTIGINAVTKSLERSIQDLRSYPPPRVVFLCKGDLAPSHLYNHLGPMIAMLPVTTLLFPLLRGSEKKLSESLGMQAVGAIAIHAHTKGKGGADAGSMTRETEDLIMILGRMVEPMTVSWLPKVLPPPLPKVDKSRKDTAKEPTASIPALATTKESTFSSTDTLVASDSASQATSITEMPSIIPQSTCTSIPPSAATTIAKDEGSVKWIPTNIKSVQTTMPIIVKTPRPVVGDTTTNSSDNGKKKGQQQQQKPQKQQQQQQQQSRHKHGQVDQSSKKHRSDDDASRGDRDKGKKPKNT
ncbi:hypothetical protein KVV02_005463 [Mortierella alpina]|uniref:Uncharacterized protein n=1 Tax=Mortierella alpina TaxID=64518 RepID=A0A9P8ACA3_MORAP|nr:hypothetical protein KVV02_005463 [Mortierella alpina]